MNTHTLFIIQNNYKREQQLHDIKGRGSSRTSLPDNILYQSFNNTSLQVYLEKLQVLYLANFYNRGITCLYNIRAYLARWEGAHPRHLDPLVKPYTNLQPTVHPGTPCPTFDRLTRIPSLRLYQVMRMSYAHFLPYCALLLALYEDKLMR